MNTNSSSLLKPDRQEKNTVYKNRRIVLAFFVSIICLLSLSAAYAVDVNINSVYYTTSNPFYLSGYGLPNCTCFAWGRAYEVMGVRPDLSRGNADSFWSYNQTHNSYPCGQEPRAHSIACWNGGDGHVAFVESVSGDTVYISQSSWNWRYTQPGVKWENTSVNRYAMNTIQSGFQGYIYLENVPDPGKPTLSINAGTSQQATYFSWGPTADTSYYTLRIYDSNDELYFIQGGISATSFSVLLPAGNYSANLASVNSNYGNWTFSDEVYFTVAVDSSELPPSKPVLNVSAYNNLQETYFSWSQTTNTTYYTLRVYTFEDDEPLFLFGGLYTNSIYLFLPAGDYYANIASVHVDDNVWNWTFSDDVSFSVGSAGASAGDLFLEVEENHRLYRLFHKECSWLEARSIASVSGGSFVSITSSDEQDVVASMVSSFGSPCWLGAETFSNGVWNWTNGDAWTYSNWGPFQPDSGFGKENCLEILPDGTWNDHRANSNGGNADNVKGYVIEYDPIGLFASPTTDSIVEGTPISTGDVLVLVTFSDQSVRACTDFTVSVSDTTPGMQTVTVTYGDLTTTTTIEYVERRIMQTPDFILPDDLAAIEESAFQGNAMQVVQCNEGLQEIGEKAFYNCVNLEEIYIPASVTSIANNTFLGCSDTLTIFGYSGSYAEDFAEQCFYEFVPVE